MPILAALGLVFLLAVVMGCRSWRRLTTGKRIVSVLLLMPLFLMILCFALSLSCGKAALGSACYDRQFVTGVLMVFFLPLPALLGTAAAFGIFIRAR